MRYFTHYWKNETWEHERTLIYGGGLMDHTAGNQFRQRGVQPGDSIYIVTVIKGQLYVSTRITVDLICDEREAKQRLNNDDLWSANEHVISRTSTKLDWERTIPIDVVRELRVLHSGEWDGLKFRSPDKLDQQTLRGVRELSPESAKLLDSFLGQARTLGPNDGGRRGQKMWQESDEGYFESAIDGKKGMRYVAYYERRPENRAQAIKLHGLTCKACGFNFEAKYGALGKDYIHVHHVKPVSEYEVPRHVDIATELTVLCANCHAMVHRSKTKTLSVEELRTILRGSK